MGKFSKDKRDIYYRKAKELGYRARSAFKLLQIARHFDIFHGVSRVVDLCAAPGGWTEVLSQHLVSNRPQQAAHTTTDTTAHSDGATADAASTSSSTAAAISTSSPSASASADPASESGVKIVAVDLQAMAPLPGVHVIQGDLTRASTATLIRSALGVDADGSPALAELVVCDGAPDVIGMHDVDESIQYELLLAAFNISLHILRGDGVGCFVAKIFRGKDVARMYRTFRRFFDVVTISKPKTCRNSSIEGFVVCQKFKGLTEEQRRAGLQCAVMNEEEDEDSLVAMEPVPFVSCWDEEQLDSDMSYPLSYTFTEIAARQRAAEANANGDAASSVNDAAGTQQQPATTYQNLTPSALPIDPPYKRSLQMKKQNMFG